MAKETFGTLGLQKETNYALRADMSKEEFVKEVLTGLVTPPQYFPKNAMMNKMGYESFDTVKERGAHALSVGAFKAAWAEEEALVLDTRDRDQFSKGYIPGSIFIGLDGSFASWVGALINDLKQPILFVADNNKVDEVITRLARVGYDNPIGYLEGGFNSWKEADEDIEYVEEISGTQLSEMDYKNMDVLDVRKKSEFDAEHAVGSINFPLDFINQNMAEIKKDRKYYLYCATGYRSLIAASILRARGINNVVNITGGYKEMVETPMERTEYVEQVTEL
jgi:rhodanese-related sulfurtransferase